MARTHTHTHIKETFILFVVMIHIFLTGSTRASNDYIYVTIILIFMCLKSSSYMCDTNRQQMMIVLIWVFFF